MISRKSALSIAAAYTERFIRGRKNRSGNWEHYYAEADLYEFLYVNNFDAWLLNLFKAQHSYTFKEFILRLHTGEAIANATPNIDWPQRATFGNRILKDLAECLIRARLTDPLFEEYGHADKDAVDAMQKALELDGYIYRDGRLWVPEETVLEEQEEQGVIEGLMNSLKLTDIPTLKHHLELSASHYADSHWDDSISNSRKVLEAVLAQAAQRHASTKGTPLSEVKLEHASEVREYLERAGLLDKKEKVTIADIYSLLSDTGSHPYIAARDQARLMRNLALTVSQFVLLRLEGALKQVT